MQKSASSVRLKIKVIKLDRAHRRVPVTVSEVQVVAPVAVPLAKLAISKSLKTRIRIEKLEPAKSVKKSKSVVTARSTILGSQLLKDLVRIFKTGNVPCIRTRDLIADLCSDLTKPWVKFNSGSNIQARQLATLLKPYSVRSCDLYFKAGNAKGYKKNAVTEAYRSIK